MTGSDEKAGRTSWTEVLGALSGVILGAVGLYATSVYNQKQAEDAAIRTNLNTIETVRGFFPHLLSKEPKEQELASIAVKELANKELAARLIEAAISDPARRAEVVAKFGARDVIGLDHPDAPQPVRRTAQEAYFVLSSGRPEVRSEAPPDRPAPVPPPPPADSFPPVAAPSRTGWAFLGTFDRESRRWQTHYLDLAEDADPSSLVGKTLHVAERTGSLNVRTGMPTASAEFQRVVEALPPRSALRVEEVQPWQGTGYYWAKVSYAVAR